MGGNDYAGNRQTWSYHADGVAGIDMSLGDGGVARGTTSVPDGATLAVCTPVIANNTTSATVGTYFKLYSYLYGSASVDGFEENYDDYTYPNGLNWLTDAHTLTIVVGTGGLLTWHIEIDDPNDVAVWGVLTFFS